MFYTHAYTQFYSEPFTHAASPNESWKGAFGAELGASVSTEADHDRQEIEHGTVATLTAQPGDAGLVLDSGTAEPTIPDIVQTPSPGGPVPVPYPNSVGTFDVVDASDFFTLVGYEVVDVVG